MHQNLGRKGRDRITGREGIITAYLIHSSGFEQVMLAETIDGERTELWFDVNQIVVLPPAEVIPFNKSSAA